jgi:hypothetical protein
MTVGVETTRLAARSSPFNRGIAVTNPGDSFATLSTR